MIIRKPPPVNFETDKIFCLTDGDSRDEVIAQYVQHRLNQLKCPPSFRREMGEEFVVELPALRNPLPKTAAYKMASAKIRAAVAAKKRIVLFGDYDCDGVTSVALLHDFLRAAGLPTSKLAAFIPLRHVHGYGLTMPAVQRCVKRHRPELLIVLDCGTNSREEIDWLTEQGIDSVIVDHHLPSDSKTAETTLLNPKAWVCSKDNSWDLQLLSAAGLAFLLVHGMAGELRLTAWDCDRAILMAGLASYVDLMPVVGLNRILVKHALRLARKADGIGKVPGLAALEQLRQASKFTAGVLDEKTFGLFLGPCLNAPGRLGDAKHALQLLLAQDAASARKAAVKCFNCNEERKKIQSPLTARALGAAGKLRDAKVIFVADKGCHPGVGGIVASDVKEAFNRPAIIASWQEAENADGGFWKASGRSIEQCNLGEIIHDAVAEKMIEGGGGHEMAGGFSFTEKQRKKLERWLNDASGLDEKDFVRKVEIIAPAEKFDAKTWYGIYRAVAPFGNGNVEPSLVARGVKLTGQPHRLKKDGDGTAEPDGEKAATREVWALRGAFQKDGNTIAIDSTNLPQAENWLVGGQYDFDLVLTEWRRVKNLIYDFLVRPNK